MVLHPNQPQQGLDKKAIVIEFKENLMAKFGLPSLIDPDIRNKHV